MTRGRVRYVQRRGPVVSERAVREYLEERTRRVERAAKRLAPGSMPRYIWSEVHGVVGQVLCDHPAVTYVVRGTRPHVIEPRRGKALRFDPGGGFIFSKRVHHPGTRANDFLSEALRSTR